MRATLEERANRTWRQWLTRERHDDFVPAVVGVLGSAISLSAAGLAIRLSLGDTPPRVILVVVGAWGVALVLAAVVLTVSFLADRRGHQRLVEELSGWDRVLHPLVKPRGPPAHRQERAHRGMRVHCACSVSALTSAMTRPVHGVVVLRIRVGRQQTVWL